MHLKKFDPSWNFSITIMVIGAASLIGALLFAHALENVRLTASLSEHTCNDDLQMCMKTAETVTDGDIKTAKSHCQNEYNTCTGQGGKIHAW